MRTQPHRSNPPLSTRICSSSRATVSTGSSQPRSAAARASSASYWAASKWTSAGTALMSLVFSQASQITRPPSRRMVTYRPPQQPTVQVGSLISTLRGTAVTASGQLSPGPRQPRQLGAIPSGWTSPRTSTPSISGRTSAQGSAVQSCGIRCSSVNVLMLGRSVTAMPPTESAARHRAMSPADVSLKPHASR